MLSLDRQNELREAYRRANPGWRPATEVFANWVRSNLRPESRILDLGCGRGGLVEQLDHSLDQVAGLDPDFLSLREHRLAGAQPPMTRVNGASLRLPFAAGSFDLVFASWVLEHLAEPAIDLCQIGRVLRPGGVFIFITPNKGHPLIGFNRLVGRIGGLQDRLVERLYGRASADTYPAYYRANDPAAIGRLANDGGMELVELKAIPDPTYLALQPALFRLASLLEQRLPAGKAIHLVGLARRI
ncbi:MAG TPA: class I SAM-dependent methyltransferase [Anaerolineae bacterium]|jgi:SAM-dependent methyltransferase|nr:class I SAM-dependent methyltransferase [Anaerolineae bacterium]